MKKIDASAHIGDSGIALIHTLVNKMGFAWHERKLDAGIDGEIELRNPATGEVANRIILVQSKASERPFPGENDRGFHYLCKDADVDYWIGAEVPVLLVCSHPNTGEAWWMHVQAWFTDPAHRASGRIDFDKNTQRFDATAASRLLNLADPHGQAHTTVAAFKTETLTSNLLTIGVPDLVYRTPTHLRDSRDVYQRQRATGGDLRYDFMLRDSHLYTWLPPQATALTDGVDGDTDALSTRDLTASTDPSQRRLLVQLLNYALRHDVSADCDWHQGRKITYFRATEDLQPRSIRGASGRARLVFNPKPKKSNPDQISYCQHAALEWQFLHTDGQWYCALVPTYHYTRDGYRDSLFLSDLLAGIKRLDRNPAVYHQTRMWATYLHGEDDVLDPRETVLDYGHLATFDADRGIDDTAWLTDPRTHAADGDDDPDSADDASAGFDEPTLFEVEA
ncbi:DUF4365 domain-containing protein [Micromonospora sp. CPCC 205371]|nr:DUF4365 domain-containing protein [Micromonospora sp. CPCC 205371]